MSDVNKQLLEAAKLVLQQAENNLAAVNLHILEKLTKAIAAAEHAQPVWQDELNCDDIERLRMALSWEGYSTPEGLEHCAARWPELVRDLYRAVLSRKKRAQHAAGAEQAQQSEPVAWKLFKRALFVGMECDCLHYLMANAHGRRDGALKAKNHEDLCRHIVAAVRGCNPDMVRRHHEDDYQAVHDGTQALTDYLDEVIGFPLWSRPDYEDLTPKFFDKFFELAMAALGVSPAAQPPAVACNHRIADARNPVVSSGYVCVDCGALFSAADHNEPPAVAVPDERAAFEAWLQENIDDTDTVRPSKEKVDAYFAVWLARAALAAQKQEDVK